MDPTARAGLSSGRLSELAKTEAEAILQKDCVAPFKNIVRKEVPHITVSGEPRSHSLFFSPVEQMTMDIHQSKEDTRTRCPI
jgi:hypothetical protein